MLLTKSLECYLDKPILHACFSILLFMYKGKLSRWIFKVDFLEMSILRIRQYVMWPTNCILALKVVQTLRIHLMNSLLIYVFVL